MVEIENQLTDFEIYDALEVKSFLPTGLCEPTCIDFIRKAFKKNLLQGFLTELNKNIIFIALNNTVVHLKSDYKCQIPQIFK